MQQDPSVSRAKAIQPCGIIFLNDGARLSIF
jgi:hypothetical protein